MDPIAAGRVGFKVPEKYSRRSGAPKGPRYAATAISDNKSWGSSNPKLTPFFIDTAEER